MILHDDYFPREADSNSKCLKHIAFEVTEACNYRCVMCDYWRIKNPQYISFEQVQRAIDGFPSGQLRSVLFTGGEPLLHPRWREMAQIIPKGVTKNVCTNGSPILIKNGDIGRHFDRMTISLDGATEQTFEKIRGYKHLSKILSSLAKLKADYPQLTIIIKMTIQRGNFREIGAMLRLCNEAKFIDGLGFGIGDFSGFAFGAEKAMIAGRHFDELALTSSEVEEFEACVAQTLRYASEEGLLSGFLYEGDLQRYVHRFRYLLGQADAPEPRRCSIPDTLRIVKADGRIKSCYYLPPLDAQVQPPFRVGELHNSLSTRQCLTCDQLLFNSSWQRRSKGSLKADGRGAT